MSIGNRVRIARKKANMTQVELGKLLNLNHSTVTRIENDKSNLTIESLITICLECNVSADWILFGHDKGTDLEKSYHLLTDEEKTIVDMIFNQAKIRNSTYKKTGNL